ncbi:ABC transporter transmembrane domain-containing protein, partial [Francisella philomiragia]
MKKYSLEESIQLQKKSDNASLKRNFSALFDSISRNKKSDLEKFTENELLNALIAVTKLLKISVDPKLLNDIANSSNLEAMAEHVGIPVRHVIIDEKFANFNSGVFFTTLDDKNVILFRKSRSYYVFECATGMFYKYESSMKLSTGVLQFYKPFESERLGIRDISKYTYNLLSKEIVYFFILGVLLSLLNLAVPMAMNYLVSDILPEANTQLLLEYSLGLFAFGIGAALFMASRSLILLYIEGKLTHYLETAIWHRVLNFPLDFFSKYKTADIAMRASAANSIRKVLTGTTVTSLFGAIFSVIYFIALCYVNWKIASIVFIILLITQLICIPIVMKQVQVMKEYTNHFGDIISGVQEKINNIQKIKTSCSENRVFSNFIKSNKKQVELRYK